MALTMAQAQLTQIKAAVDAKHQLKLCFDTVLQVQPKPPQLAMRGIAICAASFCFSLLDSICTCHELLPGSGLELT